MVPYSDFLKALQDRRVVEVAVTGGRIVGKGPEAVPELVKLLRQEAKVL